MNILIISVSVLTLILFSGIAWVRFGQYRLRRAVVNGDLSLDADIDAVRTKAFTFRLHGEVHQIKPMNVERFVEVTSAAARLGAIANKKNSEKELLDAYERLFVQACPTITRSILEKMTQAQFGAVYNLILEFLAGKAHVEFEKKNMIA